MEDPPKRCSLRSSGITERLKKMEREALIVEGHFQIPEAVD